VQLVAIHSVRDDEGTYVDRCVCGLNPIRNLGRDSPLARGSAGLREGCLRRIERGVMVYQQS
jgi:hypothetical protein